MTSVRAQWVAGTRTHYSRRRGEIPSARSVRQLADRARRGAWRQQLGRARAWEGRGRRLVSRSRHRLQQTVTEPEVRAAVTPLHLTPQVNPPLIALYLQGEKATRA